MIVETLEPLPRAFDGGAAALHTRTRPRGHRRDPFALTPRLSSDTTQRMDDRSPVTPNAAQADTREIGDSAGNVRNTHCGLIR
jgi:hypothetical protein